MNKELSTESIASTIESTALTSNDLIFAPDSMRNMDAIAQVMAQGVATVPEHLRKKPADCLAIVMQAAAWNMSPYQVAAKTHLVNGTLGYEAQLINAVVSSSTAIQGRFHYEYGGDFKNDKDPGSWVKVGAILRGESEIQWGEPLYPANVTVKNSPLWKSNPRQQSSYLALKYWARLYTPAVIMGVYTPEEIQEFPEREPEKEVKGEHVINMKPESETEAVLDDFDETPAPAEEKPVFENVDTILQEIAGAQEIDDLTALKNRASGVEGKYLDAVREAYSARGKAIINSCLAKEAEAEEVEPESNERDGEGGQA